MMSLRTIDRSCRQRRDDTEKPAASRIYARPVISFYSRAGSGDEREGGKRGEREREGGEEAAEERTRGRAECNLTFSDLNVLSVITATHL